MVIAVISSYKKLKNILNGIYFIILFKTLKKIQKEQIIEIYYNLS